MEETGVLIARLRQIAVDGLTVLALVVVVALEFPL